MAPVCQAETTSTKENLTTAYYRRRGEECRKLFEDYQANGPESAAEDDLLRWVLRHATKKAQDIFFRLGEGHGINVEKLRNGPEDRGSDITFRIGRMLRAGKFQHHGDLLGYLFASCRGAKDAFWDEVDLYGPVVPGTVEVLDDDGNSEEFSPFDLEAKPSPGQSLLCDMVDKYALAWLPQGDREFIQVVRTAEADRDTVKAFLCLSDAALDQRNHRIKLRYRSIRRMLEAFRLPDETTAALQRRLSAFVTGLTKMPGSFAEAVAQATRVLVLVHEGPPSDAERNRKQILKLWAAHPQRSK